MDDHCIWLFGQDFENVGTFTINKNDFIIIYFIIYLKLPYKYFKIWIP